ncbi:histone-like nucleoid-structuring protein Lsr2 [Cryptosporangium phraense]|uniref:Lsr2 family protein n=1 Tax=Cryptosporangium phraense TaxID=2593070 RepID=A0A545AH22_9ACTN|nr:Lsr2 family protein [Cryptosporangium phraense]
MAQKVQVLLVDDIDGGEAEETVTFSLDGVSYEIDLSSKNAATLRDAVAPYVGAARKAGRATAVKVAAAATRTRSTGSTATADREQNQAIREWAKKRGFKVSDRGRIPSDIVKKFHAS